ncbi:MAG TPA: hypothetical protein VM871_10575, partial [Flavisolibacter sp.]|nr:hypothetical protein [Flavisolibacter sp.]
AISYQLRQAVGKADVGELISYIAVPLYLGGNYTKSDSVARAYSALAPDSIHGYFWSARALSAIDTSMSQGIAMQSWDKVLTIAESNKERFRSQGVTAATYLAGYHNNIKSDRAAALTYVTRGLAVDPTNANLLNIQKALSVKQGPAKTETKTKENDVKTKVKDDGKTKVKTNGTKTKNK